MIRFGRPEIMNTDQGSQFTSTDFIKALTAADPKNPSLVAISMDGKGAWRDNVFVERLWHQVKYEEVYLRAYDSVSDLKVRPWPALGSIVTCLQSEKTAFSACWADARSGIAKPAKTALGGGVTRAGFHLSMIWKLFRHTEPPLSSSTKSSLDCA